MRQIQEPVLVEAFIAQPAVERFDVGVLVRLARFDQAQRYLVRMCPGEHGASAELLAVVRRAFGGQVLHNRIRKALFKRLYTKSCFGQHPSDQVGGGLIV